jgi:hypothetical protein
MDKALYALVSFIAVELAVMAFGLLPPSWWRSVTEVTPSLGNVSTPLP